MTDTSPTSPRGVCNTAIYARLSRDRRGLSENVSIQVSECRDYADENAWPVVGVFPDNDISASKYSKKPREHYDLLLNAVKQGQVNIILITEMPRLYRRLEELLELIKLAETTKLQRIQTTDAISYNLDSAEGIHAAINAVNNAMLEAARLSKRIKRKQRARAIEGKFHGGGRPFGYEPGGLVIRESEAGVVRECARRFIAGESIGDITRDLNERGVPTATGKQWRIENLQRTIMKKRNIGVREYEGQEYPAEWPAILTREQWDRMEAQRLSKEWRWPKTQTGVRKYLLTGFIYCGRCGSRMYSGGRGPEGGRPSQRRYRCRPHDNYGNASGCSKTFRIAEPVELLVTQAVWQVFDDPKVAVFLSPQVDEDKVRRLVQEFERRKGKLDQLVTDYATDVLSRDQFIQAKGIAEASVQEAREALSHYQSETSLAHVPATQTIRDAWETSGLEWRRNILRLVVDRVIVHPGRPGTKRWHGYHFDPEKIEIKWKF
ncbi:recombinase family protein [Streptomyces sp. TLI_146]|uniref:recombinase family protein n=1 Tax=Streptomyces sp. TLI_146 TaxID=1938858 RepID=UPI000C71233C|nr:recombinase family protein [Streptomyces sp. TLI_146]PKV88204.1 DNA invertase Pin-like site-specific DNA recombinase [Streptomyces sp. TLI_146]